MNTAIILLTSILGATTAFAFPNEDSVKALYEALPSCDQAVYLDSQYLAASTLEGSQVTLIDLSEPTQTTEIQISAPVVDIKIQDGLIYILTSTTLSAWPLSGQQPIFTYPVSQASGFVLTNQQVIVAQGLLGFTALDLQTGAVVKTLAMPDDSRAVDLTLVDSNTALAAIDDNAEGAFHGLYLIDLKSLEITRQIDIDNVYPSAIRALDQNRLMVVYFNAIWKFDLAKTLKAKAPEPLVRAWQFPGVSDVNMVGKVAFGSKYLYACFEQGIKKPMAIELSSLGL